MFAVNEFLQAVDMFCGLGEQVIACMTACACNEIENPSLSAHYADAAYEKITALNEKYAEKTGKLFVKADCENAEERASFIDACFDAFDLFMCDEPAMWSVA